MKSELNNHRFLLQKKVGRRIRTLRHSRAWSQTQMAPLVGMHVSHLSQLERGVVNPTLSTLVAVATALQVNVCDLLQDAASLYVIDGAQTAIPGNAQRTNYSLKRN